MEILARSGDPFDGAPTDSPCYRIPALTRSSSGRLVLVYDVRTSPLDLPGPNGMAVRTSDDDGATWSDPRWLREHDGGWGCGDASLIALPGGQLLCWYVGSDGTSFWDDQRPGADWTVWVARSADDGETWVHADVTGFVWPDDGGCLFASSGNGIVLGSGRILQPLVIRRRGTQERYCAMAISDDDGVHWRLGRPVEGCDETKVAQLPDGTVVLHSRSTPSRLFAISHDDGESFTVAAADLPDPGCNGGLTTLPNGQLASTLVFPDGGEPIDVDLPDPTGGRGATSGPVWEDRRNLVLRVGHPGDWSEPQVIDPGLAAYSVAVALPDGSVAVAWEYGAYDGIRFDRVRIPTR